MERDTSGWKVLFCVYDLVASQTNSLFAAWTTGDAKRGFLQAVQNSVMKESPKDFILVRVGVFDPREMQLESTGATVVCDGLGAEVSVIKGGAES